MNAVIVAVLLIAAIPVVCYLVWIAWAVWRKRWRLAGYLCAMPFVGALLIKGGCAGYDAWRERQFFANLFSITATPDAPIFSYRGERAFNGDGYSFEVFELPKAVAERFRNPDPRLLSEFPKRPDYRREWESLAWRKGPAGPDTARFVEFVEMGAWRVEVLKDQFGQFLHALKRDDVFIAVFYFDHQTHVGNVDFFLIDLSTDRFYLINFNT